MFHTGTPLRLSSKISLALVSLPSHLGPSIIPETSILNMLRTQINPSKPMKTEKVSESNARWFAKCHKAVAKRSTNVTVPLLLLTCDFFVFSHLQQDFPCCPRSSSIPATCCIPFVIRCILLHFSTSGAQRCCHHLTIVSSRAMGHSLVMFVDIKNIVVCCGQCPHTARPSEETQPLRLAFRLRYPKKTFG